MTDTKNAALFNPLQIGALTVPNRVLMAPLTRNRAHDDTGEPWDVAAEYYGQRASAGLIFTEATQISPEGKGYIQTPGIHTDAQVAAWKKITDAVHAKGGLIAMQLWHVGRISHTSLQPDGQVPVAPSAIRAEAQTFTHNGFEDTSEPRALKTEEIPRLIADYVKAAENAKRAGFDAVEVHSANGYLLDQFIQSNSNQRTDRYGGSIENRIRLTLEVTEAVVGVWGSDRVGVRLSPMGDAHDMNDETPAETFGALYSALDAMNLAFLHVVEAFPGSERTSEEAKVMDALRARWNGVYIGNGNFDAEQAANWIEDGQADAITFGRDFIANPDLPERFRLGAALNAQDQDTFYGGGREGYTDYPFLDKAA